MNEQEKKAKFAYEMLMEKLSGRSVYFRASNKWEDENDTVKAAFLTFVHDLDDQYPYNVVSSEGLRPLGMEEGNIDNVPQEEIVERKRYLPYIEDTFNPLLPIIPHLEKSIEDDYLMLWEGKYTGSRWTVGEPLFDAYFQTKVGEGDEMVAVPYVDYGYLKLGGVYSLSLTLLEYPPKIEEEE